MKKIRIFSKEPQASYKWIGHSLKYCKYVYGCEGRWAKFKKYDACIPTMDGNTYWKFIDD